MGIQLLHCSIYPIKPHVILPWGKVICPCLRSRLLLCLMQIKSLTARVPWPPDYTVYSSLILFWWNCAVLLKFSLVGEGQDDWLDILLVWDVRTSCKEALYLYGIPRQMGYGVQSCRGWPRKEQRSSPWIPRKWTPVHRPVGIRDMPADNPRTKGMF